MDYWLLENYIVKIERLLRFDRCRELMLYNLFCVILYAFEHSWLNRYTREFPK